MLRKLLRADVTGTGEGKYCAALPSRNLRDDMGRRAEPVEPDSLAVFRIACHREGSPTDESGTEKRRQRNIATVFAERECVARISNRCRGKTAVARETRKEWIVTEIFASGTAIRADATGVAKPRNADTLVNFEPYDSGTDCINATDDFMPRNNG